MSVALLIHRPPTPPQPADKGLSNRLHTSAAPSNLQPRKPTFSAAQRVQNNSQLYCCNHNNTKCDQTRAKAKILIIHAINSESQPMVTPKIV